MRRIKSFRFFQRTKPVRGKSRWVRKKEAKLNRLLSILRALSESGTDKSDPVVEVFREFRGRR